MIRPADEDYLRRTGLEFDVTVDAGQIAIVVRNWPLPEGYTPAVTDLMLRLPPGFPDAQPDMYWCDPEVRLARSGEYPEAANQFEEYLGRRWQRFSRHLPGGVWQPARDSLESYLALIRTELARSA